MTEIENNPHTTLIEEKVAEIQLSQGKVAIVDSADYNDLSQYKWCAGKAGTNCYARRSIHISTKKKSVELMHRVILGLKKGEICDHINGNGLDNRRINLRKATASQNAQNRKSWGTSKYLGVSLDRKRNKWLAQIEKEGKNIYLGAYVTEDEAALKYNYKAVKLHGEFARLNIIK